MARTTQTIGQSGFAAGGGALAAPTVAAAAGKIPTHTVPATTGKTSTVKSGTKASTLHVTKPIFFIAAVLTVLHFISGE